MSKIETNKICVLWNSSSSLRVWKMRLAFIAARDNHTSTSVFGVSTHGGTRVVLQVGGGCYKALLYTLTDSFRFEKRHKIF